MCKSWFLFPSFTDYFSCHIIKLCRLTFIAHNFLASFLSEATVAVTMFVTKLSILIWGHSQRALWKSPAFWYFVVTEAGVVIEEMGGFSCIMQSSCSHGGSTKIISWLLLHSLPLCFGSLFFSQKSVTIANVVVFTCLVFVCIETTQRIREATNLITFHTEFKMDWCQYFLAMTVYAFQNGVLAFFMQHPFSPAQISHFTSAWAAPHHHFSSTRLWMVVSSHKWVKPGTSKLDSSILCPVSVFLTHLILLLLLVSLRWFLAPLP